MAKHKKRDRSSSRERKKRKKDAKKKKKHSKHKKSEESFSKDLKSEKLKLKKPKKKSKEEELGELVGPSIPSDLPPPERPPMAPMTKEEWEKKQSVIRRVYDEATGRHRLIKGDGEVLEEIVSKSRHMEINRNATAGDGMYFQSMLPKSS